MASSRYYFTRRLLKVSPEQLDGTPIHEIEEDIFKILPFNNSIIANEARQGHVSMLSKYSIPTAMPLKFFGYRFDRLSKITMLGLALASFGFLYFGIYGQVSLTVLFGLIMAFFILVNRISVNKLKK